MTTYYYTVPRSFKLRIELDEAEKTNLKTNKDPDRAFISYGLGNVSTTGFDKPSTYANQLSEWNCTIIGPQNTNIGDRIYGIHITCGSKYPKKVPEVTFKTRINMDGVNSNSGRVNVLKFVQWNNSSSMYDILKGIRCGMIKAAKLPQPARDTEY